MKTEIRITGDGSPTLFVPALNEHYHSVHGALQESNHVFINAGWKYILPGKKNICILEIGLGTGLNAWLTAKASIESKVPVQYMAIEPFPLTADIIEKLFPNDLAELPKQWIDQLHAIPDHHSASLHPYFNFTPEHISFGDFDTDILFDLVYFDAFAPAVQPELWTESIFIKIFDLMLPGGCLVTYCAKGAVRRAMMAAGFTTERIQGPPGKREMLRATKK